VPEKYYMASEHIAPEIKAEAIRLVTEEGLDAAVAARTLGVSKRAVNDWLQQSRQGLGEGRQAPIQERLNNKTGFSRICGTFLARRRLLLEILAVDAEDLRRIGHERA
jgi:transposase-like protein